MLHMKRNPSLITPIAKTLTIPLQVAEQIIGLIKSGKMKQGDRLPSEVDLTRLLGISRIALREAKKLLEARGYIEIRAKGSTYVSIPEYGEKSSIEDLVSLDPDKIWELIEVRRILDTEAASIAATHATDKEKSDLRAFCRRAIELGFGDMPAIAEEGGRLYAEFFNFLIDSTHNAMFSSLRKSVDSLLIGALPFSRRKLSTIKGSAKSIIDQICAIVDAIEKSDPAGARQAMVAHIDYLEKTLRKTID